MKRPACILVFILAAAALLPGRGRFLVYGSGPSFTRHYVPYNDRLNNIHMGLGVEAYLRLGHWLVGGNVHFMFNDSNDRPAYWIGVAPGYMIGGQKYLWGSLALIVGGLKKAEYNGGKFSAFALPYLTVGFNRVGLNVGYIPRIAGVSMPILLVQLKLLVYPFHL